MQLYALDDNQKLVYAGHASKQKNYFCIECAQHIRLRGGPHRQTHYYHLSPSDSCKQSAKSMAHLQTQLFLFSLFPEGEADLEFRFPEINRIADVVWKTKKLVFEVQCSPISAAEILERNADYSRMGYQVIWILHDNRYNQWRVTAAEHVLQNHPFYFTNINGNGEGTIYDQFDILEGGIRKNVMPPLTVNMLLPDRLQQEHRENVNHLPKKIISRIQQWPLCFEGDMTHQSLFSSLTTEMHDYLQKALEIELLQEKKDEIAPLTHFEKLKNVFWYLVIRPYKLLFQILLERACK